MQGTTTGSRLIASVSFPLSVVTGCLRAGSRRSRSGRGHIGDKQEPDIDSVRTETPCKRVPAHIPGPLVRQVERLRSTFLSSDNPQCSATGLPLAPILAEALCSSTSGMARQCRPVSNVDNASVGHRSNKQKSPAIRNSRLQTRQKYRASIFSGFAQPATATDGGN
jgi:hypothetical protein